MFVKTLSLQWWSKNWSFFWWVVQGSKNYGFRGYFEVPATLLSASIQQPHQTCRKGEFGCFTRSQQIL